MSWHFLPSSPRMCKGQDTCFTLPASPPAPQLMLVGSWFTQTRCPHHTKTTDKRSGVALHLPGAPGRTVSSALWVTS